MATVTRTKNAADTFFVAGLSPAITHRGAQLLDRQFRGKSREFVRQRFIGWLDRYLEHRAQHPEAKPLPPTPHEIVMGALDRQRRKRRIQEIVESGRPPSTPKTSPLDEAVGMVQRQQWRRQSARLGPAGPLLEAPGGWQLMVVGLAVPFWRRGWCEDMSRFEVFEPGCFNLAAGRDVEARLNHDASQLLGSVDAGNLTLREVVGEDVLGRRCSGLLVKLHLRNDPVGRAVRGAFRAGEVTGMSAGFAAGSKPGALGYTPDGAPTLSYLNGTGVRVREVSVVTSPDRPLYRDTWATLTVAPPLIQTAPPRGAITDDHRHAVAGLW